MLLVAAAPAGASGSGCRDADGDPAAIGALRTIDATICLVNAERAARGLQALRWNPRLQTAAQAMADEMTHRRFFAHVTPDRRNLLDRVRPTGYTASVDDWALGENLAWGAGGLGTPGSIVAGWMASPGHRTLVLDREFVDIGLAVSAGSPHGQKLDGTYYVADFGVEVAPRPRAARRPCRGRRGCARRR